MAQVMPQISLQRVISEGIQIIKQNPSVLDDVFSFYTVDPMDRDYGQKYIEKIKVWFVEVEIPVVQAWALTPSKVPQITIRLATEQEDESKAAIGDHFGDGDVSNIGVSAFSVNLDVNLMTSRNGDEVLWLYYITNYILFKRKRRAEELGLQLGSFSATDYIRDQTKQMDNIWVRTIRYRCLVENTWNAESYLDINDLDYGILVESTDPEKEPEPI